MNRQTVLVTGAYGQIGKRCTEILLRRGHTVVAVDVRNDRTAAAAAALAGHFPTLVPEFTDLTDAGAVAAGWPATGQPRSCIWRQSCPRPPTAIPGWPARSMSRAPETC
ncbi:hypothetical protein NIIDMKKI_08450 [Mycobacterium kansasii]|uniref:Short chain dehydrogenase family protein n=1 Tax=Mycobacterium kansasii TaxID=1768 RepID=A0A1V3X768_MYCKA|nr:short chain dehydrogenase family protein [Mycobacterium kansasii]BCI85639.1 hypothetical protein NIIDMKKI_08450 [Mycobacterium kansasii]